MTTSDLPSGGPAGAHLDPDQMALAALGEPVTGGHAQHLNDCPRCSAEIDQLAAVAAAARDVTDDDRLQQPPPEVWERIRDDLQLNRPTVHHLPRRRWSTGLVAAAAAAGVLVGAAVGLGTSVLVTSESTPSPVASSVVASTNLVALPEHAGSGQAKIVQTATGQELVVDVSDLTRTGGFYEVWLIDPDTSAMVGLGALAGNGGRFVIPPGLDLSVYRLVDISSEPFDGDPVHSTDSVVQGELTA